MEIKSLYGNAQLHEQNGGIGYSASIRLEGDVQDGLECLNIEFLAKNAEEWKEAAIVGIRHAWKLLPAKLKSKSQTKICVLEMDWHPGDTTDIVVMS